MPFISIASVVHGLSGW